MTPRTRATLVGALSATMIAAAHGEPPQPAGETPPALVSALTGDPLPLQPGEGRLLAVHFLAGADLPGHVGFVRGYTDRSPAVAGVVHAFVVDTETDAAKAWAAQLGVDAAAICTDPGRAASSRLDIAAEWGAGENVTVVLDAGGSQVLRRAGDHLPFDDFAAAVSLASRSDAFDDYNLPKGKTLAVDGYDVVAYFTLSKAVKGSPSLVSTYRGVTYHFSTQEHRKRFAADPQRYLPTYGGWCASAMGAKGTKVEIDPTRFKVSNGRLFLFYKDFFSDALKDWNKHEREWEPAADRNWQTLTGEPPNRPVLAPAPR